MSLPQPLLTILKSHDFPPTTLRFNPTSDMLISGSADNTVRIVAIPSNIGATCKCCILLPALVLIPSCSVEYLDFGCGRAAYRAFRRSGATDAIACVALLYGTLVMSRRSGCLLHVYLLDGIPCFCVPKFTSITYNVTTWQVIQRPSCARAKRRARPKPTLVQTSRSPLPPPTSASRR